MSILPFLGLLPDAEAKPVYLQLALQIQMAIRTGALVRGTRLPSTRQLAKTAGVNRNTAVAVYNELAAQGWIYPASTAGYFVSEAIPAVRPLGHTKATYHEVQPTRTLPTVPGPGFAIPLGFDDGLPDARLMPKDELGSAYRRVLAQKGRFCSLGYANPTGHPRLREAIAAWLRQERGFVPATDEVFVTHGSQMAIYLVAQTLVTPGDAVAIEWPGYGAAHDAFRLTGARLVPIPVDERGLQVDRLRDQLQQTPIRAVYLTPHHQYPTTATLSPCRRVALTQLLQDYPDLVVVEDDYDSYYHFDAAPVLPLKASDIANRVVYIGSFSKLLAPAVRLGYLVSSQAVVTGMATLRLAMDRVGDAILEQAMAELIEEGVLRRFARKANRIYQQRRDHFGNQLTPQFPGYAATIPAGGLAVYLESTGGYPALRIGFASKSEAEMVEALGQYAHHQSEKSNSYLELVKI